MGVPSCGPLVPNNALYGTANGDQVRISKADGADGLAGKFKVDINGQTRVMDKAELENTRFELAGGDDTVTIDPGVDAKVQINGGTGTTRILGNTANVVDITGKDNAPLPQPFRIPGTPLIVIPLEAARKGESLSLFGMDLPFKSARITNESCISQLPSIPRNAKEIPDALQGKNTQPGQPSTSLPNFSVTVTSKGGRLDVNGDIPLSLHPKVVPGTPLNNKLDEANLQRNELKNLSIALNQRLVLDGTLSLRDPYPAHYVSPTELNINVTSENFKTIHPKQHGDKLDIGQVGKVRVEAFGVGGAKGDISLSFDLTRIDAALKPLGLKQGETRQMRQEIVDVLKSKFDQLAKNHSAIDLASMLGPNGDLAKSIKPIIDKHVPAGTKPSDVDKAVKNVLAEVTHPGVTVKGPMFLGLPVGYGYFSADSTRAVRAPLDGSGIGTPFPATMLTVGPTLIPAGVISEIAAPAGGVLMARDGNAYAVSFTAAGKPTLDPGSIGVAGVVALRGGFHLGGFDITGEVGWRGRASLSSSGGSKANADPVARDYDALAAAKGAAERRYNERSEGSERGQFRPDLDPPQVLGNDTPKSEGYVGVKVTKRF